MYSHLLRSMGLAVFLIAFSGLQAAESPSTRPTAPDGSTWDPAAVQDWFDDTYFNLLVDYYSEVPQRPYGTGVTRENLLASLRMARPGYVMIYAKGHSGTTAFRSRLGTEHPKLGEDPLRVYREVTRETGVRLVLYYSGLIDGKAVAAHPDWASATEDGKRRTDGGPYKMIPVCPHSAYMDEWVSVHLEEMITRYDPDGVWVDGDWGGGGACYCERCREVAAQRLGDAEKVKDQAFHVWGRNEFQRKFAGVVRRLKPDCLYSAGNTSPSVEFNLPNHMDWLSGDWFTPDAHRIMQSLAMRRYTTLGLPYEAMTCDTQFVHPLLAMRSRVKSLDRMLQEGAGLLANGGKWCHWTYPMPDGALIPSRMRLARACRDFTAERESLWLGTQSARWTAVVDAMPRPLWIYGNEPFFGASKALLHAHRSPDLIHIRQLEALPEIPYGLLVVANQPALTREQVAMLERYVRAGGTLLTAGQTLGSPGLPELLGVKVIKGRAIFEGHVLLSDGTPAGVYNWWDQTEPVEAQAWWKLYRPVDPDNREIEWLPRNYPITGMLDELNPLDAGFPAVTARRVGKGLAVHIAGDPFAEYWKYGYPTTRRWVRELLDRMQPEPLFACDAPSWVEVALRQRGHELLVHFVNGNPGADLSYVNTNDLFVDEIPRLGPIAAELRCTRQPEAVFLEPGAQPLEHTWERGRLRFVVPGLHIHACVRVTGTADER